MVKLIEHKSLTYEKSIEDALLPSKVYLPLSQHIGKICDNLDVKIGDSVFRGQRMAFSEQNVSSPVHASISGQVTSIQDWPHPVSGKCPTICIETDGKDISQTAPYKNPTEIEKLSVGEIRKIVFQAGIVGMGGAAFPTHIKLNPPKPVNTLIINGAECEPYLTGDYRLMVEKTKEILSGIDIISKCLAVKDILIAIEDNKPLAIESFKNALGNTSACLSGRRAIRVLKSQYPQGGEKQLIKNILGKEIPRGKLPFDIGIVVQNVATVFAIYEAVYKNKPLYERVVTVTGSCLSHPRNLLVRLGTPIKELIDFCGPLKYEPVKIIIGGPMMGIAQWTDMVPVIKSSTGVILLNKEEVRISEELFCIRCGACIRECPVGLMPCLINLASEKEDWNLAKSYGCLDCIECGICSYLCPANRKLVQSIKRAKQESMKL